MASKKYSESFLTHESAKYYENVVYGSRSYDKFVWELQSARLASIFDKLKETHNGLTHLDFACGTGRIISFVENYTKESTGIDISESMLSIAKDKVTKAKLLMGDISSNHEICATSYSVITTFRFFLNAEPPLRKRMMEFLSAHLNGSEARLIFNIQGNKHSLRHLAIKWRTNKGERINEMSYIEVRQLVEESGLEIESWHGFGVVPPFLHRSLLGSLMRIVDRIFAKLPFMKLVSYDLLFVCKIKT